jgi:hypothetical protein
MRNLPQYVYHGGHAPVLHLNPKQLGPDGELLCTSESVNVARRYGAVVTRFALNDVPTKTMSVRDWTANARGLNTLRAEGYLAVRVTGDAACFDFPVDMVVVLDPAAVTMDSVLNAAELRALSDGFSASHEPDGPVAAGWSEWLADLGGDIDEALESLGWHVSVHGYSVSVPADEFWRSRTIVVCETSPTSFDISDDWGADANARTKESALRIADQWRRDEIDRRRDDAAESDIVPESDFAVECF